MLHRNSILLVLTVLLVAFAAFADVTYKYDDFESYGVVSPTPFPAFPSTMTGSGTMPAWSTYFAGNGNNTQYYNASIGSSGTWTPPWSAGCHTSGDYGFQGQIGFACDILGTAPTDLWGWSVLVKSQVAWGGNGWSYYGIFNSGGAWKSGMYIDHTTGDVYGILYDTQYYVGNMTASAGWYELRAEWDLANGYMFSMDRMNDLNGPTVISGTYTGSGNVAVPNRFAIGTEAQDLYTDNVHVYHRSQVLPVQMTSFTASAADQLVTLNWRTESETENSHFNIYRSTTRDERGDLIAQVNGNGTVSTASNYRYTDSRVQNGTTYYYRIADVSLDGAEHMNSFIVSVTPGTASNTVVPNKYSLEQNFPNPFNPSTSISYSIAKAGLVSLKVFNAEGKEVATVVNGIQSPNSYTVEFNAASLPSGVYYYTLKTEGFTTTKKMVLMK